MIIARYNNVTGDVVETFKDTIISKKLPVYLESSENQTGNFDVTVKTDIDRKYNCECLARMYNGVTQYFTNENVSFKDKCACDHCNSTRNRKNLFLLKVNGLTKQVGSACLKEYIGVDYASILNKAINISESIEDDYREAFSNTKYIHFNSIILKVISFLKENVYDKEYIKVNFNKIEVKDFNLNVFNIENLRKYFNEKSLNTDNNFLKTCNDIASKDYVHSKFLGYAIWMVKDYYDSYNSQNIKSEYYGNIGDKVKGESLVIKTVDKQFVESQFGGCYVYNITFLNNYYSFVYFGDNDNIKEGNVLKSFSVKAHKEYKGIKKTTIQRPKF